MDSYDYRQRARESLTGNWLLAALVTLIALLLGGTGSSASINIDQDDLEIINNIPWLMAIMKPLLAYAVFSGIVGFIVGGTVHLGYCTFHLKLYDGQKAGVGDLFSHFKDQFADGFLLKLLTAIYVAKLLGVQYAQYTLDLIPALNPLNAGKTMLLGVLCALLSILVCYTLVATEKAMHQVFENPFVKIFVSGTLIALMTLLVRTQDYNGLGTAVILQAVAGQAVWYAFLLKLLFTAFSLAGGFRGGEIVPVLFTGATFGCFAAGFLGLPPSLGAALGMIAVFCGVTNSPIASFIMGLELFHGQGMWMFGLVVAVSYMLSGYYGLYKSQLIIYSKYRSAFVHRKTHQ